MGYRKTLACLLAISITAASFAGCSKSGSSSAADDSSNGEVVQVTSKQTDIADSLAGFDLDISAKDLDVGYDETNAAKIVFEADAPSVTGEGAAAEGGKVTISKAGCYIVTGTIADGQIVVDAGKDDKIQIVLKDTDITCKSGAPVYVKSADKVFITLEEGTKNHLADASKEYDKDGDISPDAVIFSKENLTINGSGSLEIEAGYKHGIVSKDDLVIAGGEIKVTAAKTAIEGKDSVMITDVALTVNAGTNGIVSSNDEDSTKGYICIEGGTFDITAGTDAVQAETLLTVEDGELKIITGGGSANAKSKQGGDFGNFGGKQKTDGDNTKQLPDFPNDGNFPQTQDGQMPEMPSDGSFPQMPDGDMPQMPGDGNFPQMPDGMQKPDGNFGGRRGNNNTAQNDKTQATDAGQTDISDMLISTANDDNAKTTGWTDADNTDSESMKGLKAGNSIVILGGKITIDSEDDAIHSNGIAAISGGTLELSSGDDGIHADESVELSSGSVTISKSYEGVEARFITVSGGTVSVTASDDGFNASDGSGSNFGGFGAKGGFDPNSEQSSDNADTPYLKISDGKVYVNAGGDGLDSNGNIFVEGGDTTVDGPTNGGNGALDKGDGNFSLKTTGGTLAAFGAVGMEEGFSEDSTQVSFLHNFSSTVAANTEVTIKDENGNVLAAYTPAKTWQSIVFTSDKLTQGETYTITAGEVSETVKLESINTSNSTSNGFGGFGGGGTRQRGNK